MHTLEQEQPKQSPAGVILRRREIRRSLAAWARECGFEPAAHHMLIIDELEKVVRGETKRLMILVPPGSAKSTYASVLFPPWFLGQRPGNSILSCSYSFTLAERFGKRCRGLIEQKHNVLGYNLSKHSQAAGDWATTTGSIYFAAGVGTGIAGHRADLGLIDDPIGSQEDADSKTIREKQYEWYYNDFYPRLKPSASQVIIANRRHEDDLVGKLLKDQSGKWTVIRLPMLAEANDSLGRSVGDLLWPEWYTQEMVDTARSKPRTWAGLYQQRPAPEEGNYFKKESILEYRPGDLPNDLRMYVGSDYAVRKGEENDLFCFIPAGLDTNGRLWVLPDWFWETSDSLTAVEAMLDLAARRRPVVWWAGRESITGSLGPFINERMRKRNTYVAIEELSEARDKEQKAQSIKARMAAKTVLFPSYVPNWEAVLHQLLTFPNGTHDDFVDALAKLGMGLDKMIPATKTQPPPQMEDVPLTCRWAVRSDKARRRQARIALFDN